MNNTAIRTVLYLLGGEVTEGKEEAEENRKERKSTKHIYTRRQCFSFSRNEPRKDDEEIKKEEEKRRRIK